MWSERERESVICTPSLRAIYTTNVCVYACIQHVVQIFLWHFYIFRILLFSLKKKKTKRNNLRWIHDLMMRLCIQYTRVLFCCYFFFFLFFLSLYIYIIVHTYERSYRFYYSLIFSSVDSLVLFLDLYFVVVVQ